MTASQGRSRWQLAVGIALVAVAVAAAVWPQLWLHRQHAAAQRLLRTTQVHGAHAPDVRANRCTGDRRWVLSIASLRLTAPVEQGNSDGVLDVAVGHDPATPWPGTAGEAMLLSHDVGYFAHLHRLRPGDTVDVDHGCTRWTYRVTTSAIRSPGAAIAPPTGGYGLALVTCWPMNALWWTSQRLVVSTQLLNQTALPGSQPAAAAVTNYRVPFAAAHGVVGTDNSSIGLGTMRVTGHPSAQWLQSPEPLHAEHAALTVFFAARSAVLRGDAATWRQLSRPNTIMPTHWPTLSTLDVTENVQGATVKSIDLSDGAHNVIIQFVRFTAWMNGTK